MIFTIVVLILIVSYSIVPTFYYKFRGTPIVNEVSENKFLSLTFDDGPDEKYTSTLLDLLKKYDIKATFFVVAKFAEKNPAIIKRMEKEGPTIGLHSLEHQNGLIRGPLYTNKINEYMRNADLIVSKSGGITLFEAIYSETPIYVVNPFLMQEVKNARFI